MCAAKEIQANVTKQCINVGIPTDVQQLDTNLTQTYTKCLYKMLAQNTCTKYLHKILIQKPSQNCIN